MLQAKDFLWPAGMRKELTVGVRVFTGVKGGCKPCNTGALAVVLAGGTKAAVPVLPRANALTDGLIPVADEYIKTPSC
jgi:hypothetical protein